MTAPFKVAYVTSSPFKKQESEIFQQAATLADGVPVSDVVEFEIRPLRMKEILEVKIEVMVKAEVTKAYSEIKVPCIVEHAGLIFEDYRADEYPGGLTKPMWDTLGKQFIVETHSAGRRATARAVVAYCDGMGVRTFVGETHGSLADTPRGSRAFYWDSVFVPDDPKGKASGMTYAEIVDEAALGLEYKVLELSQSTRAMLQFVEHVRLSGRPALWS